MTLRPFAVRVLALVAMMKTRRLKEDATQSQSFVSTQKPCENVAISPLDIFSSPSPTPLHRRRRTGCCTLQVRWLHDRRLPTFRILLNLSGSTLIIFNHDNCMLVTCLFFFLRAGGSYVLFYFFFTLSATSTTIHSFLNRHSPAII